LSHTLGVLEPEINNTRHLCALSEEQEFPAAIKMLRGNSNNAVKSHRALSDACKASSDTNTPAAWTLQTLTLIWDTD
jgi:hypothetical protein